jgi:hypothetical protein
MLNQSYQEVSKMIKEDLINLRNEGIETLGEIDVQGYFFDKKKKSPERYERLIFDINGQKPFSKDLSSILNDFRISGILGNKNDIILG